MPGHPGWPGRSEPRSGLLGLCCSNTLCPDSRAPQLSIAGLLCLLHPAAMPPDNSLLTACQESGTGTSLDCCECSSGIHCINFLNQVDLIVFQLYFATPSSITARWLWLLFGKIYLVVIIVTDTDTVLTTHITSRTRAAIPRHLIQDTAQWMAGAGCREHYHWHNCNSQI